MSCAVLTKPDPAGGPATAATADPRARLGARGARRFDPIRRASMTFLDGFA